MAICDIQPIPVLLQRSLIHSGSARFSRTTIHYAFCRDLNEKHPDPSTIWGCFALRLGLRMGIYLALKSALMAIVVIAGFSLFIIKVKRLVLLMQRVQGKASITLNRIPERIKVLITDVLLQSNVRRKRWPGWAHTLIFFGFLAVQPHSLEWMIRGVFPGFHVADIAPRLFGIYLFVADILAFLVLIGLGYALFRRLIVKPSYLTDGIDARLIILFTAVIIITFHLINAFLMIPSIGGSSFDYARYLTVSTVVYNVFNLNTPLPGCKSSIIRTRLLDSHTDHSRIFGVYPGV